MSRLLTLTISVLTSLTLWGQVDTSFVTGDTLTVLWYYNNGLLMREEKFAKGKDMYSFMNVKWYHDNGNPSLIIYYDIDRDTSFSLTGRKNGTVEYQDITSNGNYERTKHNKKGELIEKSTRQNNSDSLKIETFKKGMLVETEFNLIKQETRSYLDKYDIVKYYQGQVGGNTVVIVIDIDNVKEYYVNGETMTEDVYTEYQKEYDKYIKSRKKIHFYQEFTNDSVLVFEGLFKKVDQPCGIFKEYYTDGSIKTRGYYNKKGHREGVWRHYNQDGLLFQVDYYKNEEKIE